MKVLIISDAPATADIWGYSLSQLGLDVKVIDLAENFMEAWENETPDIIIIEDFNDQIEELDICSALREVTIVPILYLTSKLNEKFHLDVYQAGADECIPFPISPRLFQAKVNAWLRRTQSLPMAALNEISAGGFCLDPGRRTLYLPNQTAVRLTALETRLLVLLMSNPGKVIPPADIIEKVWGYHGLNDRKLVRNHIFRLRRKIEADPSRPRCLVSAGNSGYKFQVSGG